MSGAWIGCGASMVVRVVCRAAMPHGRCSLRDARCAVALGIAGVFIETHEDPDNSPSDGPNMIALKDMQALISSLMDFDRLAKANPLRP